LLVIRAEEERGIGGEKGEGARVKAERPFFSFSA
jgi:hypothetical protein